VSPWGDIIAEGDGAQPGVIVADIDPGAVEEARKRIPSLKHDRPYQIKAAGAGHVK
jgi:predicted amidohydrolase